MKISQNPNQLFGYPIVLHFSIGEHQKIVELSAEDKRDLEKYLIKAASLFMAANEIRNVEKETAPIGL